MPYLSLCRLLLFQFISPAVGRDDIFLGLSQPNRDDIFDRSATGSDDVAKW